NRANFSSYGAKVTVMAPGGGDTEPSNIAEPARSVLSLLAPGSVLESFTDLHVGSGLLREAGTSMACPHAAGVAALVLASTPGLTNEQVRQILSATADDVGQPGRDIFNGYGRVNAAQAVLKGPIPVVRITSPVLEKVFTPDPSPMMTINGLVESPTPGR